jgi:hypothetical protein
VTKDVHQINYSVDPCYRDAASNIGLRGVQIVDSLQYRCLLNVHSSTSKLPEA